MKTIYLSYTFAEGQPSYFLLLDGQYGLDMARISAAKFKRVPTVLHVRESEATAPLEVLCITDKPLADEVAEAIGQDAIDFAMRNGLIPARK